MNHTCKFCKHFNKLKEVMGPDTRMTTEGECRRYPTYRNKTANDWCGEFRSREQQKKETITTATYIGLGKKTDRTPEEIRAMRAYEEKDIKSIPQHAEPYVLNEFALKDLKEKGFIIDEQGIVRKETT